jgi:hypothetical protein
MNPDRTSSSDVEDLIRYAAFGTGALRRRAEHRLSVVTGADAGPLIADAADRRRRRSAELREFGYRAEWFRGALTLRDGTPNLAVLGRVRARRVGRRRCGTCSRPITPLRFAYTPLSFPLLFCPLPRRLDASDVRGLWPLTDTEAREWLDSPYCLPKHLRTHGVGLSGLADQLRAGLSGALLTMLLAPHGHAGVRALIEVLVHDIAAADEEPDQTWTLARIGVTERADVLRQAASWQLSLLDPVTALDLIADMTASASSQRAATAVHLLHTVPSAGPGAKCSVSAQRW